MFRHETIQFDILKERAFNSRWAEVPEGVIPLTAADPDFPCAPEISEAICKFAKDRYFSYAPNEGMPAFKESMAHYFQSKRNYHVSPANVLPVDSAAFAIYLTCQTFLDKGDEAIIFDPVDYLFRYSIEAVGAHAVPLAIPPGTNRFDVNALEKCITSSTKLICLCNPLNPTGKVFSEYELREIGELACKYNLIILSDEIWSDIVFQPSVFVSIASLDEDIRNRTIMVTGFSKSYGLAGLRIGTLAATNDEYYKMLVEHSMHHSTVHGANILSQVAADAALTKCEYWLKDFLEHLYDMRRLCVDELNSIPGFTCIPPQGCYVAFVNIEESGKDSKEIQEFLLEKAGVSVVPGLKQWFGDGAEGYFRISFATSRETLKEALNRIQNALEKV